MKRIITILMVVLMVFSLTSCDAAMRASFAEIMGNMGQNVLGSDTSAAADAVENTKVDKEAIKPVEKTEKTNSEGITVQEVEVVPGLKVELTEEEAKKVETTLPPMAKKEETIKNIGSALKNEASKDQLIKDMKVTVKEPEVQKAAQGTAVVMQSALDQIQKQISKPDASGNPPVTVPPAVQESLKSVSESLSKISEKPETVTQADVVTLQLVNDFVATVNSKSEEIAKGEIPTEVLTDANNLFTVTSALSEASKFNPNTLIGAVVSGLSENGSAPQGKAIARAAEPAPEEKPGRLDNLMVDPEIQNYINIAYNAITEVISGEDFPATKSALAFHKMSYENYANMASVKVGLEIRADHDNQKSDISYDEKNAYLASREFVEFKTFTALTQYAVATAFSEGDDFYNAMKAILDDGITIPVNDVPQTIDPVDTSSFAADLRALIIEFAKVNPWIKTPSAEKAQLVIPEKYHGLADLDPEAIGQLALGVMSGKIGDKVYFKQAMNTCNTMLVFTDLGALTDVVGNMDLNYQLMKTMDELYK